MAAALRRCIDGDRPSGWLKKAGDIGSLRLAHPTAASGRCAGGRFPRAADILFRLGLSGLFELGDFGLGRLAAILHVFATFLCHAIR